MPSRDPNDLHPELRERWEWMRDEWARRHPEAPEPFLTCTHRPASEQQALVDAGRSNARAMASLHNYMPALAFDVAFDADPGPGFDVTWTFSWFQQWGELAEEVGLEWGGRWPQLVDGPHVQWQTTWRVAQAGQLPPLPPLPEPERGPLLPVATLHLMRLNGTEQIIPLNVDAPARVVGSKLFANEAP